MRRVVHKVPVEDADAFIDAIGEQKSPIHDRDLRLCHWQELPFRKTTRDMETSDLAKPFSSKPDLAECKSWSLSATRMNECHDQPSSYPLFSTILAAALFGAPLPSLADDAARDWFTEQGYVPPRDGTLSPCHWLRMQRRLQVMVVGSSPARPPRLIDAAPPPELERRRWRKSSRLTRLSWRKSSAHPTRPVRRLDAGAYGQMDCVDETANTTSLWSNSIVEDCLHTTGWSGRNRGALPRWSIPARDSRITETQSGDEWAVIRGEAPGQKPDILPLSQWRQDS